MTYRELRAAIKRAHKAGLNYRKIGKHFDVSHSIIHKIAKEGYKPRGLEIRMKLGLIRRATKWNQLSKKDLLWALENRKEFVDE